MKTTRSPSCRRSGENSLASRRGGQRRVDPSAPYCPRRPSRPDGGVPLSVHPACPGLSSRCDCSRTVARQIPRRARGAMAEAAAREADAVGFRNTRQGPKDGDLRANQPLLGTISRRLRGGPLRSLLPTAPNEALVRRHSPRGCAQCDRSAASACHPAGNIAGHEAAAQCRGQSVSSSPDRRFAAKECRG